MLKRLAGRTNLLGELVEELLVDEDPRPPRRSAGRWS